ncbi:hypothetical protein B0T22DRAFT_471169 [Podospora appendiculata]|uniref:Secreted protein n=1 Tax=Podospora appendiculata TaxID=314037 RepID=A0AAE0X136_9PEZI|nr:hypothetical protein B0T22DRAFT_471169 [Podospora appendiculata]
MVRLTASHICFGAVLFPGTRAEQCTTQRRPILLIFSCRPTTLFPAKSHGQVHCEPRLRVTSVLVTPCCAQPRIHAAVISRVRDR